jgi:hypothetical protein
MHNSQGNTVFESSAQEKLLRASSGSIHELCLSCHAEGGSGQLDYGVYPPVVWSATNANFTTFNDIGSAGDFADTGDVDAGGTITGYASGDDPSGDVSLGVGHSIGATTVAPPGAVEAAITTFTCTNCHDAHGTKSQTTDATADNGINVFRNLKTRPVGGGGAALLETTGVVFNNAGDTSIVSYVGGASQATNDTFAVNLEGKSNAADTHIWPIYQAGSHNVYGAGGFNSAITVGQGDAGMSGWCAQCHDNWHEDIATANKGTDWTRHPINCDMNDADDATDGCIGVSASGIDILDWTHYDLINDDFATNQPMPLAKTTDPSLGDYSSAVYYGTASGDRVFCLSCHFAHAGPYNDALRWDYTSAVSDGSQDGNAIASFEGCQQCHNRGG